MVEHAELFTRKAGEEIVDQLYHFDLHDRHLALRPEMTPSIARMVIAQQGGMRFPIRWFTVTQNWRYERMTRGRRREHYQWNMDIWGEPGVEAEAELLAAMFSVLDALGLARGQVKVRLNSRALLEEALRQGVLAKRPDAFEPLCVVIDKIDKIGAEAVTEQLCDRDGAIALSKEEASRVLEMLDARSLDEAGAFVSDGSATLGDLRRLYELLDAYGIADQVPFDASVVRGLAYYTGVVFEAFDAGGTLRAIAGGGRYDRLAETLGGKPVPAVGFGFGDAVIGELLEDEKLWPELRRDPAGRRVRLLPGREARRDHGRHPPSGRRATRRTRAGDRQAQTRARRRGQSRGRARLPDRRGRARAGRGQGEASGHPGREGRAPLIARPASSPRMSAITGSDQEIVR